MVHTVGSTANTYYFQRNLQGDVVAIYNKNGTLKAKYLYDAWGNCTISSETTDYDVANVNPIRYRGYYYDSDTGLYYCNARYYSPKWRRFISPDDTAYLDPESVNGLNLYCYCGNNPIHVLQESRIFTYAPIGSRTLGFRGPDISTKTNYLGGHRKATWFDTDWPSFFVLSKNEFEIVNWGLSIYKGAFYFDHNKNHSVYVGVGNASAYAGVNFKEGIGIDVGANVVSIGYDGRVVDASIEGLTVGITYMYKDGKMELGIGAGWIGWSFSIDFLALFNLLFGGS